MDFASQNLTAGQLNAIVKKLGGEQNALRFLRGELVVSDAKPKEMTLFKTIRLGLHKNSADYCASLKSANVKIGDYGDDMLDRIPFSQEEVDLEIVALSVRELGFWGEAEYRDICAKAIGHGFELCPAEVGPALRLQYLDQPRDERILIAMNGIPNLNYFDSIFSVEHATDGLWLVGSDGHLDNLWKADRRFAFVLRR